MEQENKTKKIIYTVLTIVVLVGIAYGLSCIFGGSRLPDVKILSGVVQDKNEVMLEINTTNVVENDGGRATRTVSVHEKIKIEREQKKDPIAYAREVEAYRNSGMAGNTTSSPPSTVERRKITWNDVKIGDFVTIKTKEDVFRNQKVSAVSILILSANIPITQEIESALRRSVSGIVGWKGVSEDRFSVDNPADGKRVQIVFDPDTLFVKQENKSKEEFEKDLKEFQNFSPDIRMSMSAPTPFKEVSVPFSSINIGDTVSVEGFGDEEISVKAQKVRIINLVLETEG